MDDISKFTMAKAKYKEGIELLYNSFKNDSYYSSLINAIDLFQEAIEINNECIEAYFSLAYIAYLLNKVEDCTYLLKKVLELEPFNIKAQKMLKEISSNDISIDNKQEFQVKKKEEFLSHIMQNNSP